VQWLRRQGCRIGEVLLWDKILYWLGRILVPDERTNFGWWIRTCKPHLNSVRRFSLSSWGYIQAGHIRADRAKSEKNARKVRCMRWAGV
jgi:hypothetical protein